MNHNLQNLNSGNSDPLVNRVAESGLITINFEDWATELPVAVFDLKDYLVQEMVLMEKPFRQALSEQNFTEFADRHVCVFISNDAIIPMWAFMLVASKLSGVAKSVFFGSPVEFTERQILQHIQILDPQQYANQRVVIKGCGDLKIGPAAYIAITEKLTPHVQSLMFGEPCSTVPVFKRKKTSSP